jgi:carbon storage regulator CsrA
VTILAVQGNTVRIGIEAPKEVPIVRQELARQTMVAFPCSCTSEAQAAG